MHVLVEASYMNSHWCAHYLRGITAQAKRKNMPVSVHTTTEFLDDPSFNDTHVIVLGSSLTWASRSMNLLYSRDVRPIVLAVANYQKQFPFASFITMDYDDATRKLMKFLHAGGRTKTAFFSGNTKSSTDMQKVANYLQEGGREQDIFHFEGTLRETTDRLLARIDEFDSVLCANDVSAVVLMKRLESLGFNLPEDMHIVSFGDTVLANLEIHNIAVAKVKSVEAGKLAISAYRLLAQAPPALLPRILEVFNTMALGVCEGQQYDMDFESKQKVSVVELTATSAPTSSAIRTSSASCSSRSCCPAATSWIFRSCARSFPRRAIPRSRQSCSSPRIRSATASRRSLPARPARAKRRSLIFSPSFCSDFCPKAAICSIPPARAACPCGFRAIFVFRRGKWAVFRLPRRGRLG